MIERGGGTSCPPNQPIFYSIHCDVAVLPPFEFGIKAWKVEKERPFNQVRRGSLKGRSHAMH